MTEWDGTVFGPGLGGQGGSTCRGDVVVKGDLLRVREADDMALSDWVLRDVAEEVDGCDWLPEFDGSWV